MESHHRPQLPDALHTELPLELYLENSTFSKDGYNTFGNLSDTTPV